MAVITKKLNPLPVPNKVTTEDGSVYKINELSEETVLDLIEEFKIGLMKKREREETYIYITNYLSPM